LGHEGAGLSNRRWLIADERGSIAAVTDGTGAALAINTYDEYGNPGAANLGRFQYTGQAWFPELGLYHYKARFYDPATGRFLQTDPIGMAGGMNLYAYAGGDPVNASDPSGMFFLPPLPRPAGGDTACSARTCVTWDAPGKATAYGRLRSNSGAGSGVGGYSGGPLGAYDSIADDGGGRYSGSGYQGRFDLTYPANDFANTSFNEFMNHATFGGWGWTSFGSFFDMTDAILDGDFGNAAIAALGIIPAFKAAKGTTTLYRAVSAAEHADIAATGLLRAGPNSFEGGKWFAESLMDASRWGMLMDGPGRFSVIQVTFPKLVADRFLRHSMLDGVGPARFARFDQMGTPLINLGRNP
jgi:RHS repeat-associated protein